MRRTGKAFLFWRDTWMERKLSREEGELADMHWRNAVMQRAFEAWENRHLDHQLRKQVHRGALAWGRRRLASRALDGWAAAVWGKEEEHGDEDRDVM